MSEQSSPTGFADVLAQSPYAQLLGVEMQLINATPQFVLPFRPENIGMIICPHCTAA